MYRTVVQYVLILLLCVAQVGVSVSTSFAQAQTNQITPNAAPQTPPVGQRPPPLVSPAYDLNNIRNGGEILRDVVGTCKIRRAQIIAFDVFAGDGVWFTEVIVDCIRFTIRDAFASFISALYPLLEPIVWATVTLCIVIFGVLMATGVTEKASRDTFVILFKIGCVAYFVQTEVILELYGYSQVVMDELTEIVFTFGTSKSTASLCQPNLPFFNVGENTIWDRVDCMLDFIIGIKGAQLDGGAINSNEPIGISRGLIFFFMSNLTNPGVGFFIGLMGLFIIWSFLMALLKAVHTYLAAVLAISFIMLLSPLFVPLLLFKKTRQYFDKWYRMIGSFILQPVILFAFLSLFMTALDYMLVTGKYSLLSAACGPPCAESGGGLILNGFLENNTAFGENRIAAERSITEGFLPIGEMPFANEGMSSGLIDNSTADSPYDRGQSHIVGGRAFHALDYEFLGEILGGTAPAEVMYDLTMATILLTLTMFVFLSFLNYIPVLATDITGGMFEVPNLAREVGNKIPMGEQFERASQTISANVRAREGSKVRQFTSQVAQNLGIRP